MRADADPTRILAFLAALGREASPAHFIPELPGWQERSIHIDRFGPIDCFHYDPYAQALSKIERGHPRDRLDVASMLECGLVEPARLRALFERIVPALERFPAIDPDACTLHDRPSRPGDPR